MNFTGSSHERPMFGAWTLELKGVVMHLWMNNWDWFWMTFMVVFWVVVLGAVVFIAVRLAQRPPREGKS